MCGTPVTSPAFLVLGINQAWAGMPGALVDHWVPKTDSSSQGKLLGPRRDMNLVQLWAKKLPGGSVAVLLINASPQLLPSGSYKIRFSQLNISSSTAQVRDVWQQADLGTYNDAYPIPEVSQFDSVFVILKP